MDELIEIASIYTTHPDEHHARRLCEVLLNEKWIACANLMPAHSMYVWNDQRENHQEYITWFKTRWLLAAAVTQRIQSLHNYEVPCICIYKVQVTPSYALWIERQTREHG